MKQTFNTQELDLLGLHSRRQVNQATGFTDFAKELKPEDLVCGYRRLLKTAPSRHSRRLRYFVGHTGVTSSGPYSNRREEHLATALWNQSRENGSLKMPDVGDIEILDYQFPLKARQNDKGVGKVDLFGVVRNTKPCVIELKIHPSKSGRGDTPLRAFLEALAYCAIVEANANDISQEALSEFGHTFTETRPALIVMATEEYWSGYIGYKKASNWWPILSRLADQLEKSFGLKSYFPVLRDANFNMGLEGNKSRFKGNCSLIQLTDMMT